MCFILSTLVALLLSVFLQYGDALKCYQCRPVEEHFKHCHTNNGELQECNKDVYQRWLSHMLPTYATKLLNETANLPLRCAKLVDIEEGLTEYGKACMPNYDRLCKLYSKKILIDSIEVPLITDTTCSFCSEDGCNHSPTSANMAQSLKFMPVFCLIIFILGRQL